MNDIIVTFEENQGGFGDILFAAKLVAEIKKKMLNDKQLVGDVYLVATGRSRNFVSSFQKSQIDLEFGFNFVTTSEINTMIEQGKVNPAVIIEAPTPTYNSIKRQSADTRMISAREYSYGPFIKVNMGHSYEDASSDLKEKYQTELQVDEESRMQQYSGKNKEVLRTGIIAALNEKGILLTSELVEVARESDEDRKFNKKSTFIERMPEKARSLLFKGKNLAQYEEETELTFGYSHKSNRDFLKIHAGYVADSLKNQDVFIASAQPKEKVKDAVEEIKEKLIEQGFSKIVYTDYETGEEATLHDDKKEGKVYRLIHSNGIPHPLVVALTAISGPLCLASGDQSFGEAISADKIICYETYTHKRLLNSSYQHRAKALSEDTQEALHQLSVLPEDQWSPRNSEKEQTLYNLGRNLRNNEVIREEISQINQEIVEEFSLADHFVERILMGLPPIENAVDTMIMQGNFDPEQLPNCTIPHHLHLAIRYGNFQAVQSILEKYPQSLLTPDHLQNNAFIIAAQSKQDKEILPFLIAEATKRDMSFSEINKANNHIFEYTMCHYLAPEIKNNPDEIKKLFGPYKQDVTEFLAQLNKKPEKAAVVTATASLSGFFATKAEPTNIWELLSDSVLATENESLMLAALEVARQYLKAEQRKFNKEYLEVCRECSMINHNDNWPAIHLGRFTEMLELVREHIQANKDLEGKIGLEWLPKAPTSLVKTMKNYFDWFIDQHGELKAMEELKPILIVINELCKANPDLLVEDEKEQLASLYRDFGVEADWAANNQEEFSQMADEVLTKLKDLQEFSVYEPEELYEAIKTKEQGTKLGGVGGLV